MRTLLAIGVVCGFAVPAIAADPDKADRYGDPLPKGALMRLGTTRARAPITGFGIEKDGTVVTVGENVDVRRWEPTAHTGEPPLTFPLADKARWPAPQVSPDGKFVAAVGRNKVFVWEEESAKQVATFEIERAGRCRFAPDGTKLAVTTEPDLDNRTATVHVCDIATKNVQEMDGGAGSYVEGMAFSGDSKRLAAVGGYDLILWDTATGKRLAKNKPATRMFGPLALNRAGDVLIGDGYTRGKSEWVFLDPMTAKVRDGLIVPPGGRWAAFTADDKALLIGGYDNLQLWDPIAGKVLRTFEGVAASSNGSYPGEGRFSPDGKLLVASNGSVLLRWNVATGKPLFAEQNVAHNSYVNALGVSPDGKRIATRGGDHRTIVWDAETGRELWQVPAVWSNAPNVDFSPDNKFVYVAGPKGHEATKYDAATGKPVLTVAVEQKADEQGLSRVRLAPDGKTLFGLSSSPNAVKAGGALAWDTTTGKLLNSRQIPAQWSRECELAPNGEFIVGSFFNSGIVAVGAPDKNLMEEAKVDVHPFLSAQFSDDGKWLAYAGSVLKKDQTEYAAVVLSTADWKVVTKVPLTKYGRTALTPDGRTLAVAIDEDVEFYDVVTAKRVGGFRVPYADWTSSSFRGVRVMRFTPDGTKLITGHADTTALVWPVPKLAK